MSVSIVAYPAHSGTTISTCNLFRSCFTWNTFFFCFQFLNNKVYISLFLTLWVCVHPCRCVCVCICAGVCVGVYYIYIYIPVQVRERESVCVCVSVWERLAVSGSRWVCWWAPSGNRLTDKSEEGKPTWLWSVAHEESTSAQRGINHTWPSNEFQIKGDFQQRHTLARKSSK